MTTQTPSFVSDDPEKKADDVPANLQPNNDSDPVLIEFGGRKYTKAALETKLAHSENHIKTLESERATDRGKLTTLETELSKAAKTDEVLKALQAQAAAGREQTPLDTDKLVKEVREKVEAAFSEKAAVAEQAKNWNEVTSTLTAILGKDGVNKRVAEVASEAGMTLDEAAQFAKNKPKAFLRMFPETQKRQTTTSPPVGSSIRNSMQQALPDTKAQVEKYQKSSSDKERAANFNDYAESYLKKQSSN